MSVDIENAESLAEYLGEPVCSRVLAGGVSNRTVLVERASGERWVLKQALEKLRVPVDWFCAPERIEREAAGMEALRAVAPPGSITRLIFVDPQEHVLAMEAVAEPHENWKTLLLAGRIEAGHFRQFGELLRAIGNAPHVAEFDDRSYFEALRLEPYYAYTAQQVPETAPFLNELMARTRATRRAMVHGDFSPKNVLVREGRLVLLDHEVIHWGDPSFDTGFAMAHFLSKARHLPAFRERLMDGAAAFAGQLADCEGAVEQTLGCLLARVAGRSQLEYLSEAERLGQRGRVLELIARPPRSLGELLDAW